MSTLVVEVINVDDDVAESALKHALNGLNESSVVSVKLPSLHIEPHDDYRGIIAKVDLKEDSSKSGAEGHRVRIMRTLNSFITMELQGNSKAKVQVQFTKE
jgi:hypothetical protein